MLCYNLTFDTCEKAKPRNSFIYKGLRGFEFAKKVRTTLIIILMIENF